MKFAMTRIITSLSGGVARHLVVLLLLGAACYFGVRGLYQRIDTTFSNDRQISPQEVEQQAAIVNLTESSQVIASSKEAITSRNLFIPLDGDSGIDYTSSLLSAAASDETLLLIGTVVDSTGVNRAVILEVEGNKQHMVKKGDEINGATVMQINSGKIIISRRGRNQLLDIDEALKLRSQETIDAVSGIAMPRSADTPVVQYGGDERESADGDMPLQIDLGKLQETNNKIIVKGRINNDI